MRDYYLHARVIHRVSRRLIARCRETLSRRATVQRRLRQEALADGLVVIDEQLHLAQPDGRAFREEPLRLLKVFWHRHQLGFELGIDVERAIEESLDLIDDAFRASAEARDLFLGICRNWGRVAQTFREMHELGVLGPLPARVGRADLPRAVRRLPQVLRRPALADRGAEPGGARAGPVGGLGGQRAGGERAGASGIC